VEVAEADTALEDAALVVNALSVQPDLNWSRVNSAAVVMDMTYKPVETRFLAEARARGHGVVDGLAMLIGQAGPSFEALFGRPPPALDIRPILLDHLARAAG
jgi:shikimate dehydrogenase